MMRRTAGVLCAIAAVAIAAWATPALAQDVPEWVITTAVDFAGFHTIVSATQSVVVSSHTNSYTVWGTADVEGTDRDMIVVVDESADIVGYVRLYPCFPDLSDTVRVTSGEAVTIAEDFLSGNGLSIPYDFIMGTPELEQLGPDWFWSITWDHVLSDTIRVMPDFVVMEVDAEEGEVITYSSVAHDVEVDATRTVMAPDALDYARRYARTAPEAMGIGADSVRTYVDLSVVYANSYFDSLRWEWEEDQSLCWVIGLTDTGGSSDANIEVWVDAQATPNFHVDTYQGPAAEITSRAGTYVWWCGTFDYDMDGGYGNNWDEMLDIDSVDVTGAMYPILTYDYRHDSETAYDFTRVQAESGGVFVDLVRPYDGYQPWTSIGAYGFVLTPYDNPVFARFRFVSDASWSDEDGLYNSSGGGFMCDNVKVYDYFTGYEYFYDDVEDGIGQCVPRSGGCLLGGEMYEFPSGQIYGVPNQAGDIAIQKGYLDTMKYSLATFPQETDVATVVASISNPANDVFILHTHGSVLNDVHYAVLSDDDPPQRLWPDSVLGHTLHYALMSFCKSAWGEGPGPFFQDTFTAMANGSYFCFQGYDRSMNPDQYESRQFYYLAKGFTVREAHRKAATEVRPRFKTVFAWKPAEAAGKVRLAPLFVTTSHSPPWPVPFVAFNVDVTVTNKEDAGSTTATNISVELESPTGCIIAPPNPQTVPTLPSGVSVTMPWSVSGPAGTHLFNAIVTSDNLGVAADDPDDVNGHLHRYLVQVGATGCPDSGDQVPMVVYLAQNRPNPFGETTDIHYGVRGEGLVDLAIYNLAGQKVRTLVHERQDTGDRAARWDGMTEQGTEAVAGIYFCRLRVGDTETTRKLVLVR